MAKRIDYKSIVGLVIKNKLYGDIQITEYLGKVKNDHMYEGLFLNTGNKELLKYKQVIGKTKIIDHKERKKLYRVKKQKEIIERNRLIKKGVVKPIPKDLGTKNCLSLDAATLLTGWTVFIEGVYKESGVIKPGAWDLDERCKFIAYEIRDLVEKNRIKEIMIEDIYLGFNSNIQVMLAELRGYIKGATRIPVHEINIKAWKSFYWEMPNTGREDQKEFAIRKFIELFEKEPATDDEAESGLIGYFAINKWDMKKAPFKF